MASTRDWFESVAEAQRRAEKRLPKSVYGALIAGAERGITVDDNIAAFVEVGFFPRIATGLPSQRQLATTVLGQPLSMPVFISPDRSAGGPPRGRGRGRAGGGRAPAPR